MLNLKNDSDEDKLERRGGEKRRGEGSLSGRGDVSQARGRSVGELFSGDIHVWYLGAHSVPPHPTHTLLLILTTLRGWQGTFTMVSVVKLRKIRFIRLNGFVKAK